MRLTTGISSGKAAFYDRNPLDIQKQGGINSGAPHSQTQRFIYTVPAARKCQITTSISEATRVTAAGTASQVTSLFKMTPNGGSTLLINDNTFFGNNIDSGFHSGIGTGPLLLAGDAYEFDDSDASTTGTCYLQGMFMGTEFDA